jgi:multidrug efflux pump subunit AcrA (membrane-fusion protein)
MRIRLKYVLPGVAALYFLGGAALVAKNTHLQRTAAPPAPLPSTPFAHSIGAEGLIEPVSEDIAIAPAVPGLVTKVHVEAQRHVRAGDVLWEQDNRGLAAQVSVRESEIASAHATVKVGEAALADAQVQLTMIEKVADRRAIREEDLERRRIAVSAAKAQLKRRSSGTHARSGGTGPASQRPLPTHGRCPDRRRDTEGGCSSW